METACTSRVSFGTSPKELFTSGPSCCKDNRLGNFHEQLDERTAVCFQSSGLCQFGQRTPLCERNDMIVDMLRPIGWVLTWVTLGLSGRSTSLLLLLFPLPCSETESSLFEKLQQQIAYERVCRESEMSFLCLARVQDCVLIFLKVAAADRKRTCVSWIRGVLPVFRFLDCVVTRFKTLLANTCSETWSQCVDCMM